MNCEDVDLCEECENSGRHPLNHFVYKTFVPQSKPLVLAKGSKALPSCEKCIETGNYHQFISLEENRYYCKRCAEGIDAALWKIKCGVSSHVVPEKDRGHNPRGACCDVFFTGCNRHCTGINWKCTHCWATDICENCDEVFKQAALEGEHPVGYKTSHTLACAVMKIYYVTPSYDEWGLNMDNLFTEH